MGLFFIWLTLALGVIKIGNELNEIRIESKSRNAILERQNIILKEGFKNLENKK